MYQNHTTQGLCRIFYERKKKLDMILTSILNKIDEVPTPDAEAELKQLDW